MKLIRQGRSLGGGPQIQGQSSVKYRMVLMPYLSIAMSLPPNVIRTQYHANNVQHRVEFDVILRLL